VAGLERELALARSELAETGGRLREAELRLEAAHEREELTARSYRAAAARIRQELASWPRCRKPLRGSDLLVSGHCPHCGKALSSLLTPVPRAGGLEGGEYLALLGALSGVVGFVLAESGESAGVVSLSWFGSFATHSVRSPKGCVDQLSPIRCKSRNAEAR
jgi:hypothetical protein